VYLLYKNQKKNREIKKKKKWIKNLKLKKQKKEGNY